ncbi:MAG: AI-2E family transporter [Desulfobacterales bacterium]|nr:MAG: AI-2E family transporter [Desulfobacterales bacterium]
MDFDRTKVIFLFQGMLALVAVGLVLKHAAAAILPLTLAWLLSHLIEPAVDFSTRRKIPASLAIFLILILLFGIFCLSGIFLYLRISSFTVAYPTYQTRLIDLIAGVTSHWNIKFDPFGGIDWEQSIARFLVTLSGSIFLFVSNLILVIVFLFFILLGKPYFQYKIVQTFSEKNADQINRITYSIKAQIRRYLFLNILVSFVTGLLVWMALLLIGVDFPITWGAMAFFLNFIPTVGSIAASIPPILLAVVQFYPNIWPGVATLIAVTVIQLVIGNVVTPKFMGDQLNLSPVVVLVALLFWGWLWGIVGALISVPIAVIIKIVCENIEPLHPIGVIMGTGKSYRRTVDKSVATAVSRNSRPHPSPVTKTDSESNENLQ